MRIADHIVACYSADVAQKVQADIETMAKKPTKDERQIEWLADTATSQTVNEAVKDYHFIAPKISLVTATASSRVKEDLDKELVNKLIALTDNKPLVQYGTPVESLKIWRDNIEPHFEQVANDHRLTRIYQILRERKMAYEAQFPDHPEQGVALVYLRNRKTCEEYAKHFAEQQLKAVAYHGKLDESQKKLILQQFKNDELDVVVCTNAFGMGIDKAGIHTIIHSGIPNNLESYVQEIGRGARKSHETAHAYMLWDTSDIERQFKQERDSRIPNTETLKNCWQQIRPILKRPLDEQWFAGSLLSPILAIDDDVEQLNTQIRVALLALERYGLLVERDQQPAWISIKLLHRPTADHNHQLLKLYDALQQINDNLLTPNNPYQTEQKALTRYHLPELAVALGYSVKKLLNLLRQLVNLGFAQWEIVVNIRLNYAISTLKARFNKKGRILEAMTAFVDSDSFQSHQSDTDDGFNRFNTKALDQWLVGHQYSYNARRDVLPLLRGLGIIAVRHQSYQYYSVSATDDTKAQLTAEQRADTWHNWLDLAKQQLALLSPLLEQGIFPKFDKKDKDIGKSFQLDDLAEQFERSPTDILHQLEQLQKLEIIEMSRLDDDANAIFFIGANKTKKPYNAVAYRYLQQHYEDRCMRIHVLNHWLGSDIDTKRLLMEDYFRKPLGEIVKKYLPADTDATRPYLKDYKKLILPSHFSDIQQQIIQDKSRASMILAGPGAGKTTVVVHRVAYLLMIEEIKPEKILILAYNRLAVCELRERLHALVGTNASGVTILTFHALARQITSLSEKDAPPEQLDEICVRVFKLQPNKITDKDRNNARYQWLIEQAISQLKETPQHFQYIMVDEFQDIDQYQYELIGLLADLQLAEDDEAEPTKAIEPTEPAETTAKASKNTNAESYDQRGYLMVVGDDDQNLYAFRGASIEFIQQFEQNYHLDTQQKFYLLNNYRSANNIVALANAFIRQVLPPEQRLKDDLHQVTATQPYPDTPIRYGVYQQPQGIDMASWIAHDIQAKLVEFDSLEKRPTIAVLAPKWQYFDAVQHYLEMLGISSQRYNESDQLIPMNSFIGQALYQILDENRLQVIEGSVVEVLQEWCEIEQFNPSDKAWVAILDAMQGLENATYELVLQRLETTQYESDKPVSLITYHSAKGMEFDHVYVIDQVSQYQQGEAQDSIRPLYVALTRAKQSLTVLQHQKKHQPILAKLLQNQAEKVDISSVAKPDYLKFHRFLQLEEIVLTPKELVLEKGRQFIERKFAKGNWRTVGMINNRLIPKPYQPNNFSFEFFTLPEQLIARLSGNLSGKLTKNRAIQIQWKGFTTMRFYQQNMDYYVSARYTGVETSHYLIVPFIRFKIKI